MNITICAIGPVADALGGSNTKVVLVDGSRLGDLMNQLGREKPSSKRYLWRSGEPGAHFFREGRPLLPEDFLREGDHLDILLSVAGG